MRDSVMDLVYVNEYWQSKLAKYHKKFVKLQDIYDSQLLSVKTVSATNLRAQTHDKMMKVLTKMQRVKARDAEQHARDYGPSAKWLELQRGTENLKSELERVKQEVAQLKRNKRANHFKD